MAFYFRNRWQLSPEYALDDINKNKILVTRHNYVTFDGIPYDEKKANTHEEKLLSTGRHSWFDSISYSKGNQRRPEDLPSENILKKAEKYLTNEDVNLIRTYASKYVAHAATKKSRAQIEKALKKLTLRHFEKVYRDLISAAKIIERLIGEYILAEVPTFQFDVLENWDQPLMTIDTQDILKDYWTKRKKFLNDIESSSRLS